MSWINRFGERFTGLLFSAATVELPVVNEGVWHSAHPISLNFCLPFAMEVAPPGELEKAEAHLGSA